MRNFLQSVRRPSRVILGVSAALYLVFSLAFLETPGLEYDEVVFANAALGDVDGTFIEWAVPAGARRIPMMVMTYLGALKAWIYAPIFALFGPSVASVRLPVVCIGLATLGFTFLLARAMLGAKVALVATLLLACDPAFVFANRLDWGPTALQAALRVSALYLLWRWLEHGGRRRLAAASFLLGLGLWDKVIFAWFLAALALALPIAFGAKLRARLDLRAALVGLAAFVLGCAPFLAYNLVRPLATFRGQALVTREWRAGLPLRLRLFRDTLDGSAVASVVNAREPETLGLSLHRPGTLAAKLASPPATPAFYLLVASIGAVGVLALRRRLRMPREIAFHVILIVAILAFIYATAQGTGPHHVVMVHPFSQIVIAFALCELAALPSSACIALVVASSLVVDVGYLRSFVRIGGRGKWSDAIYGLASFMEHERRSSFLLMDWGFSNPLLVLSRGRIRKEEAFVGIVQRNGDEARIAAMHPYLIGCSHLFVFHMPRYETYPLLRLFKRAAARYGLDPKLVRLFRDREGDPLYLVYRALPREVEAHLERGKYFWFREGEEWDAKQGGALETRPRGSRAAALGMSWGSAPDHFATYRFDAPRRLDDARLTLRYAFESTVPKRFWLRVDDRPVASVLLEATAGPGLADSDWKLHSVDLGTIAAGRHAVTLTPGEPDESLFVDFLYIAEGELTLRTDPLPPGSLARVDPTEESIAGEVLAMRETSAVRLEVEPAELAGDGSVTYRLSGFEAPAIDVLYELDGKTMPLIYDWQLDAHYSVAVAVDGRTPKGLYRIMAIRDSRDRSPVDWVRVDVSARIR